MLLQLLRTHLRWLRRILQSGSGLSQCDQDSSASAAASTGGSRGEGAGLEGGMEGEQTCYKTAAPEPEEAISSDRSGPRFAAWLLVHTARTSLQSPTSHLSHLPPWTELVVLFLT